MVLFCWTGTWFAVFYNEPPGGSHAVQSASHGYRYKYIAFPPQSTGAREASTDQLYWVYHMAGGIVNDKHPAKSSWSTL
jgi:hypothetical protein